MNTHEGISNDRIGPDVRSVRMREKISRILGDVRLPPLSTPDIPDTESCHDGSENVSPLNGHGSELLRRLLESASSLGKIVQVDPRANRRIRELSPCTKGIDLVGRNQVLEMENQRLRYLIKTNKAERPSFGHVSSSFRFEHLTPHKRVSDSHHLPRKHSRDIDTLRDQYQSELAQNVACMEKLECELSSMLREYQDLKEIFDQYQAERQEEIVMLRQIIGEKDKQICLLQDSLVLKPRGEKHGEGS